MTKLGTCVAPSPPQPPVRIPEDGTTDAATWEKDVWWEATGLTSLVQRVVDKEGWASGNAVGFQTWNNTDSAFSVYSRDYSAAACARLQVTYHLAGSDDLTYYTYDSANALTRFHDGAGWTYFDYDGNGNTVMEQTPAHVRYFDYDGRDVLTGVRSDEEGWTDNVYRYDGGGARVATLESGGLTYYDWDGAASATPLRRRRSAAASAILHVRRGCRASASSR